MSGLHYQRNYGVGGTECGLDVRDVDYTNSAELCIQRPAAGCCCAEEARRDAWGEEAPESQAVRAIVALAESDATDEIVIAACARCALYVLGHAAHDDREILGRRLDAMIAWAHGHATEEHVLSMLRDRKCDRILEGRCHDARIAVNHAWCREGRRATHARWSIMAILSAAGPDRTALDAVLYSIIARAGS